MLRKLAMTFALVSALTGCQLFPPRHKAAADFDQALLDQQLIDAARAIERTQAELRSVSAVSTPASMAAAQVQHLSEASTTPMTIEWSGDATDLARLLAMHEGLVFDTRGVRVPLPITLSARQTPYRQVVAMFLAQVDYRATLYTLPGRMVLEYTPLTGVTH
jgi:hypothetical protein